MPSIFRMGSKQHWGASQMLVLLKLIDPGGHPGAISEVLKEAHVVVLGIKLRSKVGTKK